MVPFSKMKAISGRHIHHITGYITYRLTVEKKLVKIWSKKLQKIDIMVIVLFYRDFHILKIIKNLEMVIQNFT